MQLPKFAVFSALLAFAAGGVILCAWEFGWRGVVQPLPNLPPEMPIGAVGLCLAALALGICAVGHEGESTGRLGARALALILLLGGGGLLTEHLLGLSFGLERLLYADRLASWLGGSGGMPSAQVSISLVLYGAAVFFFFGKRGDRFDLADVAAAASLFLPAAALLRYLFDADRLDQDLEPGVGIPPYSALGLALLAAGLQSLHPRRGLASLFAAQPDGGIASRRMMLAAITVPMLFGYLQVRAIRAGAIDLSFGVAITVAASVLIFVALIVWNAELVVRLHVEQRHQLATREEQARHDAVTDALTGLHNRRGWEQCLVMEELRCQREGRDACVFVIDLDDLKKVNDRQGHARGDELLRRTAQALRSSARRLDVVARIGGDEFGFLATETLADSAAAILERLRRTLLAVGVTASIGYSPRSRFGSLAAAAQEADTAMYEDKRLRKQGDSGQLVASEVPGRDSNAA